MAIAEIMGFLRSTWIDQDGGEVVEYAILIGILVIGIAAIVINIREGASSKFSGIANELQTS